jgi:hypothetical protein
MLSYERFKGNEKTDCMTQIVHVANTNVEFEFANPSLHSLELSLSHNPLCLQLQFLPLLYAQPEDFVAVTALPSESYLIVLQQTGWWPQGLPQLVLLQEHEPFQRKRCLSWGPSRQVQAWAKARQMNYALPNWQIAQLVNSKAFSFRYTCLSEAALLYNEQALLEWLQEIHGPKVLKTCFGLSGKGNWCIDDNIFSSELLTFCRKEWQQKRPIIAEPWLDRLYDFSTQWLIHSNGQIDFIGATRFETDAQGSYQGTLAGPEDILFVSFEFFLQQHRQFALKALTDIAKMGFFGYVGIDALLYRHPQNQSVCLYPLVEINGRQTMSLVALRLQQRICPHQILHLAFQHRASSLTALLPSQLINAKEKTIHFWRDLTATILPPEHLMKKNV